MSALLIVSATVLLWSAIRPVDYGVWFFEIIVGLIGIFVLATTCRRFRFSDLVYLLAAIHFAILAVGGKYTYAEMPLFNWLKDALSLSRNHYDRVGHFAQGFVPALIVREILLRTTKLQSGKVTSFLVVCVCLAFSALYELIEWGVVMAFYPTQGPERLGMQGDPWDTQEDMFIALCGAMLSLLTLSRVHDLSMKNLKPNT